MPVHIDELEFDLRPSPGAGTAPRTPATTPTSAVAAQPMPLDLATAVDLAHEREIALRAGLVWIADALRLEQP